MILLLTMGGEYDVVVFSNCSDRNFLSTKKPLKSNT